MRLRSQLMLSALACLLLGAGIPAVGHAAAPNKRHSVKAVQAQLKVVEAEVSKAQARNGELQAQVATMERENADREKRLKQRDEEIAALQRKLEAAGAPAAASSAQH